MRFANEEALSSSLKSAIQSRQIKVLTSKEIVSAILKNDLQTLKDNIFYDNTLFTGENDYLEGTTALQLAAETGRFEIVQYFISVVPEFLFIQNQKFQIPFDLAKDHQEVAKFIATKMKEYIGSKDKAKLFDTVRINVLKNPSLEKNNANIKEYTHLLETYQNIAIEDRLRPQNLITLKEMLEEYLPHHHPDSELVNSDEEEEIEEDPKDVENSSHEAINQDSPRISSTKKKQILQVGILGGKSTCKNVKAYVFDPHRNNRSLQVQVEAKNNANNMNNVDTDIQNEIKKDSKQEVTRQDSEVSLVNKKRLGLFSRVRSRTKLNVKISSTNSNINSNNTDNLEKNSDEGKYSTSNMMSMENPKGRQV